MLGIPFNIFPMPFRSDMVKDVGFKLRKQKPRQENQAIFMEINLSLEVMPNFNSLLLKILAIKDSVNFGKLYYFFGSWIYFFNSKG